MRITGLILAASLLAGCTEGGVGDMSSFGDPASSVADVSSIDYYPNDQAIVTARVQFENGHYGKAHTESKRAVEVASNDPQALLIYAASLDRLRRFDQADVAYRKLEPLIGDRIEFHNNYGYSQLLRGNLPLARQHFLIAYEMDPSNETVANNLEMLRNSTNYQRRGRGDLRGIGAPRVSVAHDRDYP
ncbi:MAG: hypothetical protein H5U16_03130 [Roseovarius sp.]|nr:hypothetical protein [Roseovarius sp.]